MMKSRFEKNNNVKKENNHNNPDSHNTHNHNTHKRPKKREEQQQQYLKNTVIILIIIITSGPGHGPSEHHGHSGGHLQSKAELYPATLDGKGPRKKGSSSETLVGKAEFGGKKRLRVHGKSARDQEFGVQGLECRVQGVLEYGRCWGREPRKPNTP